MSNLSDVGKVGEGIAVAFVATIYGVGVGEHRLPAGGQQAEDQAPRGDGAARDDDARRARHPAGREPEADRGASSRSSCTARGQAHAEPRAPRRSQAQTRPRPDPASRGTTAQEARARQPRALARVLRRLHHAALRLLRGHVRRVAGRLGQARALRRVGERRLPAARASSATTKAARWRAAAEAATRSSRWWSPSSPSFLTHAGPSPRASAIQEVARGEARARPGSARRGLAALRPARRDRVAAREDFFRAGTATPAPRWRSTSCARSPTPSARARSRCRSRPTPTTAAAFSALFPRTGSSLTAARAARLARFLVDEASFEPERLSAAGLAEYRPAGRERRATRTAEQADASTWC